MMENKNIALEAEHLVKAYGGLKAVNDVSIHLYENEILGLIGPNGAGKTTLFNLISGTQPMTSGMLKLFGKSVHNVKSYHMASLAIGRTFQVVQPFLSLTVLENTMTGAFLHTSDVEKAREESMEILKFLELDRKMNTRGEDLALIDLKRLEVARAMATKPKILLLDEVMAGLTPSEGDRVIQMIHDIRANGMSIILVEHVMRAVMNLCDRIYVLDQGQLIAEGTPAEVSSNQRVIESYLGVKKNG
mgnify:CR=1 FL=1